MYTFGIMGLVPIAKQFTYFSWSRSFCIRLVLATTQERKKKRKAN